MVYCIWWAILEEALKLSALWKLRISHVKRTTIQTTFGPYTYGKCFRIYGRGLECANSEWLFSKWRIWNYFSAAWKFMHGGLTNIYSKKIQGVKSWSNKDVKTLIKSFHFDRQVVKKRAFYETRNGHFLLLLYSQCPHREVCNVAKV